MSNHRFSRILLDDAEGQPQRRTRSWGDLVLQDLTLAENGDPHAASVA